MGRSARIFLLLLCEALFCGVVAGAFWYQDWRYALPTPRPAGLEQSPLGSAIQLPNSLAAAIDRDGEKLCLVHFFNPGCPCSRFNVDHLRELVRQYGDRVQFVAVLEGEAAEASLSEFLALKLGIAAVFDADGAIAASLGVYATPQAIVLDGHNHLVFRGNYNASRFCVDRETEFARLAIDYSLRGGAPPPWPEAALVAQGCELPANVEASSREANP